MNFDDNYQSGSPMKTGIKWGIFLGLAGIAIQALTHFFGMPELDGPPDPADMKNGIIITLVTYVVLALFFFFAVKDFKNSNSGLLSIGEGITTSMFVGLVSGVIIAIIAYVYMAFIAPDFAENLVDAMVQDPELHDDQKDKVSGIMSTFMSPGVVAVTSFFSRLIAALIFGLIVSLILKNDD